MVKVKEYSLFFCDAVNEHYDIIMKYPPSKVAAVCHYFARKCCQLRTLWGIDLEEYTGYKENNLRDIIATFEKNLGPLI